VNKFAFEALTNGTPNLTRSTEAGGTYQLKCNSELQFEQLERMRLRGYN
jgi:hypothetical protein